MCFLSANMCVGVQCFSRKTALRYRLEVVISSLILIHLWTGELNDHVAPQAGLEDMTACMRTICI